MKLANNLDFNKYEAQNMKLQSLATAPASPAVGQAYFDTTLVQGRIWDGTAWKPIGSSGSVTAVTASAPLTSSGGTTPNLAISAATTGAAGSMSAADKTKLDGVATGATANATDAALRDRSTHTGTQAISTVTGLQTAIDAKLDASKLGVANGAASLDGAGKIPNTQLPAIGLTDVTVVATIAARDALVTTPGVQEGDVAIVTGTAQTFIYDGAAWQLIQTPVDGVTAVTGTGPIVSSGGNTPQISIGPDSITSAHLGSNSVTQYELDPAVAGNGLTGGGGLALQVGAGLGLTLSADVVAIDTSVVPRKYSVSVGDGTATSFVISHNLNTRDVIVGVYLDSATYEEVLATVEHTTTTTVTVRFATPPATFAYRVVVQG